ncbi:K02A2.6-like, partial [Cordylochernes scorpioides]
MEPLATGSRPLVGVSWMSSSIVRTLSCLINVVVVVSNGEPQMSLCISRTAVVLYLGCVKLLFWVHVNFLLLLCPMKSLRCLHASPCQSSVVVVVVSNEEPQISPCISITAMFSILELFLEAYKRVFENKDLPIQGIKGSISLRPNAKPKFFKFRPVPFSIKEKIDKELDRLEQSQIIEKVNASDWSTPLVTVIKSNGELRLCGDFKNTLNNCIEDEKYPLPTIETMLGNLGGNKIFTKLDLSSAYHQIEMDEASKNLLVVSTHRGLYRYNRLPFGISPASAIFQRCMDSLFHDVPNTVIYLDDIFIGSKDEQEHYRILKMIFDKLKELNFTLNKEKCLFKKKKDICFRGHIINEDGVRPDSKKLEALERRLFNYSMKLPLTLTCDASAYGISGVLCHIVEGEEKPITFVSKKLSSAEAKYSQTEKEALAIVFATSKLRQYLFGRKFVLKSDHKALPTVFGNKRLLPPLIANRLHRWALELSNFDFDIRYTNKDTMLCADAFSRLPLEEINSREDNIDLVTHDISFLNVTPLDHLIIEEETNKDPVLNKLKEYLLEDPQLAKKDETMKPFLSKLDNFSILQGCIFVDSRAVIPRTCQDQMLKLLHQGHIGINRMKSLARSSVWWPKMDSQIEEFVKECSPCMHHQTAPPAENTPWPRTNQPWQRVHVDHFYFRGDCYLLVVDANSNWIEVFPVRGTTSQENIKLLRECFARYGLPQCLVSDNGPPFNSLEFKFLRKNNVYHLTSPAYNPTSNGIAEGSVRIIKKSLEKSLEESPNSNMDCILQNVLFNYRNTPTSLDKPPVERLLSYVPRTFVNCLNSEFIQRTFGRNECGRRHFQVGDKVLFTRVIQNRRKWFKAQVIRRLGYNVYLVKNLKGTFKVHVNQMRTGSDTKYAEDSDWTLDNAGAGPHRLEQDPQISTSPPPRRSTRPRCPPCRFSPTILYCKYTTCLHSAVRPRVARAPEFFASGGRKVSRMATNFIRAESPSKAEQKPVRHGSLAHPCAELSANQDLQNETPIVLRKNQNYVNPPAGGQDANSAAPVDLSLAAIPTSNAAAQVRRNWADITEEVNPGAEEGFTLVQGRKRRRGSGNSPTTAAPSSNAGASRTIRRPQSSAGSVPRAQEIRATRAHIADARARQASSSEEHCVYIEHSPELEPFHYLRALDRMLGGTAGVIQITKVNGHQLLGLTNRGLAERLISEGLKVEGTLLRAFPFRKRAERITVGNLPFFVADSAVITALSPYGRVTSIAPKQMKAGPYVYVDGRRDVFITLHEGITIERLPTRLDINIKGQAWPAYLSSGIRCSRCHGQGHRRAICPLLAGLANNTRTAPPTTPAGVPPPTTPAPPQRSAAQPPAPAPSNLAMEVCSAPPMARAVLHPSAPRPSPPATPALPMEETPSAPPPVIPAPSLQVPKNPVDPRSATPRHPEPTPPARPDFAAPHGPPPIQETLGPAAPTQDVEMSIVEETTASSASSTRNATGDDLVAFIEGNPSVSFARTDALGLGREEVLDLLSSRTKAQRNGPLLSPPQCDALVGLIGQILDLKPGHTSNLYKVLGQVRAELTKTPAAAPTPPLPAPRPTGPTPPVPHEEQMAEEQEDVMIFKIFRKLKHMTCLRPLYDTGIDVIDLKDAILFTEDTASLMTKLSPALKGVLAEFLGAAIELARSYHHD